MASYYNENNGYCAKWLRNLIAEKIIPDGVVDERDIRDVAARDLNGFAQCHFFAGMGGWPYALRLAGVPDDYRLWTGSCPCQPFSAAGKRAGFADERHLWPAWFNLIKECRPAVLLGEQVASAKVWLDLVSSDMERISYAFGASVLPAACVGARHLRHRIFFVAADTDSAALRQQPWRRGGPDWSRAAFAGQHGAQRHLADANCPEWWEIDPPWDGDSRLECDVERQENPDRSSCCGQALADADSEWESQSSRPIEQERRRVVDGGQDVADAGSAGLQIPEQQIVRGAWRRDQGPATAECDWWAVEPDVGRMAHGIPARVPKLRALGNAIVPQVAAAFAADALDALTDQQHTMGAIHGPEDTPHPYVPGCSFAGWVRGH